MGMWTLKALVVRNRDRFRNEIPKNQDLLVYSIRDFSCGGAELHSFDAGFEQK